MARHLWYLGFTLKGWYVDEQLEEESDFDETDL